MQFSMKRLILNGTLSIVALEFRQRTCPQWRAFFGSLVLKSNPLVHTPWIFGSYAADNAGDATLAFDAEPKTMKAKAIVNLNAVGSGTLILGPRSRSEV